MQGAGKDSAWLFGEPWQKRGPLWPPSPRNGCPQADKRTGHSHHPPSASCNVHCRPPCVPNGPRAGFAPFPKMQKVFKAACVAWLPSCRWNYLLLDALLSPLICPVLRTWCNCWADLIREGFGADLRLLFRCHLCSTTSAPAETEPARPNPSDLGS